MKDNKRVYHYSDVCAFRKTKAEYGGLSNMASGYPLQINNNLILSSEALYQACRFPHMPDVQKKIISQRSPMSAKMVGKPHRENTREDWDSVRLQIMRWSLRVKLAQNFLKFGELLESTGKRPIVEETKKEKFWGATPIDKVSLSGVNALGRLLMELRDLYTSRDRYKLLTVPNPEIGNFLLFGEEIKPINELDNFISFVTHESKIIIPVKSKTIKTKTEQTNEDNDNISSATQNENEYKLVASPTSNQEVLNL